jgi:hypothetical protein
VDAGPRHRAGDRGRQVAVADELDPGAGGPDLGDERIVTRPLEDDDRDVAHPAAERIGDPAQVLGRPIADVDLARRHRPDAQLFHVRVRGVGQPARLGRRKHGDRAGLAVGDQVRSLERVDRDVHARDVVAIAQVGAADPLADVQHRRLVAFALTDDDPAGEVDLVHRPAHRLGRRRIGPVLLVPTHEPRRLDRRRHRHPDHLEREELLHQCLKWRRPVNTIAI